MKEEPGACLVAIFFTKGPQMCRVGKPWPPCRLDLNRKESPARFDHEIHPFTDHRAPVKNLSPIDS